LKFKGQLLPDEDLKALEQVLQILRETQESVKVYDVSRTTDKLRALKRGIRNTPAVIINGEKYESLEAISQALSENQSSKASKSQG
jgi:protein-disulfide isomerase